MNLCMNKKLSKECDFMVIPGKIFAVILSYMYFSCIISCQITDSEKVLFTSSNNEIEFNKLNDSTKYDSNIKHLMLKGAAKSLQMDLRHVTDNELGIVIVQDIFNSLKMQHSLKTGAEEKTLKRLSKRIEKKIQSVVASLNETVEMIEDYGNLAGSKIHFDCSGLFTKGVGSECQLFRNSSLSNVTVLCSSLNISEVFQKHRENIAAIKNEYFLPAGEDYRSCASDAMFKVCLSLYGDYCQPQPLNDPYFEQIYLKSIDHNRRQIVLILDHGSSLSHNQLAVAKSLSKYIVASLGLRDQVCIIGLSGTAISLCDDGNSCENNKHHLLNFIDSFNTSKGSTNHSLGFELAFDLINSVSQNSSTDINTVIIYISKGLLSSITEARTVLEVIALGQKNVFPRVVINTCALIDEWKPVLYEKHFLRDIALQNFSNYNVSFDEPLMTGIMEEISVSSNSVSHTSLGPVARRLMGSLHIDDHVNDRINFFLPQLDEIRTDPVVVISRAVQVKYSGIVGVVAVQVFLEDIVEDIIYFNNNENTYAFVINTDGVVLMHPSLRQVSYYVEQPWITDVSLLEIVENISVLRMSILNKNYGEQIAKQKNDGKLIEYSWQKLENAPYIVVIASEVTSKAKSHNNNNVLQFDHLTSQMNACTNNCDLVYSRLDYLVSGPYTLCRHNNDLTTLDAGSLFLSASCFQSPFKYLLSDKNASYFNIQNYMAYIKDKTKLLANPGLKTGIRGEIISLSTILPHWKKQFFSSKLNKYIVRRYIATNSGIMIMYPGTQVHHRFDPSHCVWFTSAVSNPSRLMLTAPYPDPGESGYIVTISQAFISSSTGTTIVVAMDVTFGYLFVLLMDILPYCSMERGANENVKCFIMDDRGYLLFHPTLSSPGLMDSNGKPPVEGQHINYKESLVANDILNHKGLVEKLLCSDFTSGTVQRYYQFNISVTKVFSNIISGEQCVQYQLAAVPGTNIFIGVVNTTCDNSAFCPCSRIDRHCINCDRMEQTACECPCECPMNIDCNTLKQNNVMAPPCVNNCITAMCNCSVTSTAAAFHLHQSVHHPLLSKVKSCTVRDCHNYLTYRSCVGVVGCEWCNYKSDGVTLIENPFCTVQTVCFNGVLGSNMPFGERTIHGSTVKEGSGLHTKSSSTGAIPMGGAVVALLFALALMCYCYHKRSQTSQVARHDHNCVRPVSLFALEKSNINRIIEEPPTEPHNGLLQSAQEVSVALLTPVSPYLMNTGYCRPPTGDSDHGYSTMTPHEEVEVEPQVPVQQTLLSHHILAPVTVHMVMDT